MTSPIAVKPITDTTNPGTVSLAGIGTNLPPKQLPTGTPPNGTLNTGATGATPTAPTGTGTTTTGDTSTDTLTYTQIIEQTLASWGLSSLDDLVDNLGRTGASQDEITLRIQQSPEYAARFAGNAQRVANGLGVLDPATYIALEGQYRQILSQLPAGFYDSKEAFDNFIGNDISPSELSDRVSIANQAYILAPQAARDAYNQYYGNTSGVGGAIASILDTKTAAPLIEQRALAAEIGGAAVQQGLSLPGQATATQAAAQGVTLAQAQQSFQQIASRIKTDQAIGGRFGSTVSQQDELNAGLLGQASDQNRLRLLSSEEAAQFGSRGGASPTAGSPGGNF